MHKFYKGLASAEEKEAIKQWLESDPRHADIFFREREFFDAVLLSVEHPDFRPERQGKKRFAFRRIGVEALKIAAVAILMFASGVYFHTKKAEKAYRLSPVHTVSVPAGQRACILLSDGTKVWLNARSEIKYPASFSTGKREVELNGEAYFEVSHNEKAPFTVHTEQCDVEVTGTTFNVDAYRNSRNFSVALIEGSVKVVNRENPAHTVTLLPRHRAGQVNGVFSTGIIDDYDVYRWRDGLLCFKDISMTELLRRLEACYDVRIIIENDKLSDHVISGKFRISDGIDNALRILQKDAKYTFVRDSETEVIYIR
ncbi:MAG: FecR domain-containing protein [Tannerellaceae bacterium]|nr:FecR domain-containing protein [Tannerellaceae bacterium]